MANHRSPRSPSTPPRTAPPRTAPSSSLAPSGPPVGPSTGIRHGRFAAAAVAVGALAAAAPALTGLDHADAPTAELASLSVKPAPRPAAGPDPATSGVLPAAPAVRPAAPAVRPATPHAASLAKASRRAAPARPKVAAAPFVKPAQGTFTSGFGSRWGASHNGVDIANSIGTPIVSVADGVVTAAGPASGFGQWVKVRLADGTETVYGHVNRFFVHTGEKVSAGERIAEIGNKGESTGPHLHFEVHTPGGKKINPLPWLAERGISLGSQKD